MREELVGWLWGRGRMGMMTDGDDDGSLFFLFLLLGATTAVDADDTH